MPRLIVAFGRARAKGIVAKRKARLSPRGPRSTEPGSSTACTGFLGSLSEAILKRNDPCFDALIVGEKSGENLHYKKKVRFEIWVRSS
jgi:hypothetical protein